VKSNAQAALFTILGLAATLGSAQDTNSSPCAPPGEAAVEFRLSMRKLWEEHIAYTRNYIISALAELPDAEAVAQRLMRNQDDIGNAVKPYYGSDAGDKLAGLLRDHIKVAAEVVQAATSGEKENLTASQKKWSANAMKLAEFLSDANPKLSRSHFEEMLQKHLDLTTGEVVARLKRDWATDIKAYDAGHVHMLMFSDALVDGIVEQFPEKFPR